MSAPKPPVVPVDGGHVRVLLLDIEGTTTPIDFVYKTLFPFADWKVLSFLNQCGAEPEVASLIADLRAQHDADQEQGLPVPPWSEDHPDARMPSAAGYVRWLIARDSKCTPLKALQGKIWQQGFDRGELHGEVYEDVPRAFARWRRQGRSIAIYSSGSVLAQQLLFRTVASGDLTPQIAAYFDTQAGIKTSPESYAKIAASLRREPGEILFLSDAPKEVSAALQNEMPALLCDRSRSAVPAGSATAGMAAIHSFDEVLPD